MEDKDKLKQQPSPPGFIACMLQVIGELKTEKKFPAMRTHVSAMNSFTTFINSVGKDVGKDVEEDIKKDVEKDVGEKDVGNPLPTEPDAGAILLFSDALTPGRLKAYQDWLLQRDASWDTVSTYMRRLKATYNRILPPGSVGHNPKLFADVYTKVEPKTKRALPEDQMNTLAKTDFDTLPEEFRPVLAYFLLMFYFRGMPFIDLAYLRKRDVRGGLIVYCRHKTGRQLTVRIPREAEALFREYSNKNPASPYLFPILDGQMHDEWGLDQCYQKALRNFNRRLAMLANLLLPGGKLSSYTPRHTWATLAYHMGIKIGVIRQALGHSSIRVTETYLKPFEDTKVDEANDSLILAMAQRQPPATITTGIPMPKPVPMPPVFK